MYLQSLATAFPPQSLRQAECLEILEKSGVLATLKGRSREILGKVLTGDSGIETRRFCEPALQKIFGLDASGLHRHFEQHAPRLASEALLKALRKNDWLPSQVDALLVCTCTGYLCPGLSSYISEILGLRQDAFLLDMLGLGCGAALPLLETARGILAGNPRATLATVAVEVSSSAFFLNDDPGVLISLCLFGDGAAAAIWKGDDQGGQFRFQNFRTVHKPEHREKIRFVNSGGRLKNQLHRKVPTLAAEAVSELFEMRSTEPDRLLAHTGGRDIVEAIEHAVPRHELAETRAVLRKYGNISSPSVLAALEESLQRFPETENLWLTAFGAGFAAHCGELKRER
jgi:alkylresorcinol/alkylpyrone synthase